MFPIFDDFNFSFQLLTFIGLWELKTKNLWKVRLHRFYQIFMWLIFMALSNFLQYVDLYFVRNNLQQISLNFCGTIIVGMCLFNSIETTRKSLSIKNLKMKLEKTQQNALFREEYGEAINEIRSANKILFVATYFVGSCWMCSSLLDSNSRKLPVRQWIPFSLEPFSNYVMAYVYQVIAGYYVTTYVVASSLILFGFLISIVAEFKFLEKRIRMINNRFITKNHEAHVEEKEVSSLIQEVIMQHQDILLQIKKFQAMFNMVFSIQVVSLFLLLIVVGLAVLVLSMKKINAELITQVSFLMNTLFYMFLLSFFGTKITQKSYDIVNAVYDTPWYEMSPRCRRSLLILISQAQRPPQIRAGGILSINLATYLNIVKFAYELFMMCRPFITRVEN